MDTKNWKYFELREFCSKPYKGFAYNAQDLTACNSNVKGAVRYVTRKDTNNGCRGFVINEGFTNVEKGNAITIGDTTSTIFYQEEEFICGDHILILRSEKFNKLRALFIVSLLNRERFRYNYGRAFNRDLIYSTQIKLPIDKDNNPDWIWIETFILNKIIPNLPIKVRQVLQNDFDINHFKANSYKIKVNSWRYFNVGEIFDCKTTKHVILQDVSRGNVPLVTRSSEDNGLSGYIDASDCEIYKSNCITIGAEGLYAFYQPFDFVSGVKVYTLRHEKLNQFNAMFICTILNKEIYRYNYGNARILEKIKRENIKLPALINKEGVYEPDWQWMEDYVKGLPYSSFLI